MAPADSPVASRRHLIRAPGSFPTSARDARYSMEHFGSSDSSGGRKTKSRHPGHRRQQDAPDLVAAKKMTKMLSQALVIVDQDPEEMEEDLEKVENAGLPTGLRQSIREFYDEVRLLFITSANIAKGILQDHFNLSDEDIGRSSAQGHGAWNDPQNTFAEGSAQHTNQKLGKSRPTSMDIEGIVRREVANINGKAVHNVAEIVVPKKSKIRVKNRQRKTGRGTRKKPNQTPQDSPTYVKGKGVMNAAGYSGSGAVFLKKNRIFDSPLERSLSKRISMASLGQNSGPRRVGSTKQRKMADVGTQMHTPPVQAKGSEGFAKHVRAYVKISSPRRRGSHVIGSTFAGKAQAPVQNSRTKSPITTSRVLAGADLKHVAKPVVKRTDWIAEMNFNDLGSDDVDPAIAKFVSEFDLSDQYVSDVKDIQEELDMAVKDNEDDLWKDDTDDETDVGNEAGEEGGLSENGAKDNACHPRLRAVSRTSESFRIKQVFQPLIRSRLSIMLAAMIERHLALWIYIWQYLFYSTIGRLWNNYADIILDAVHLHMDNFFPSLTPFLRTMPTKRIHPVPKPSPETLWVAAGQYIVWASVRVLVACYRERAIWLSANQATRAYLLDFLYEERKPWEVDEGLSFDLGNLGWLEWMLMFAQGGMLGVGSCF